MKRDGVYWYDENAAETAVEFFPRFLVHLKGPLAGDKIELDPWQKDEWIRPLFGWKRPHTVEHKRRADCDLRTCEYGRRRYQMADVFLPRKNTKTTVSMGIALILCAADDEMGAEVYLAAFDQEQAGIGFEIAATMVEKSKVLRRLFRIRRSKYRMAYPRTDSFIQAIPSEAAGSLGFNAHGIVYDEYQEALNDDLDDALETSQGVRAQPLMVRSFTAGKSINTPAGRLYRRMRDVLDGVREPRDDELIVLHEAKKDADWKDPQTWIAANPSYGLSVQPRFVKKQITTAESEPAKRPNILRFGLNIWPDYSDTFMPLEKWDACAALVNLEELEARKCYLGVGMSSALDLAGVVAVFPPLEEGGKYRIVAEHFIPRAVLRARAKDQDAPPYAEWERAGWLHVFDGDVLDYKHIENVVRRYTGRFEVAAIACNPRGAMQFMQNLLALDLPVVEVPATEKYMSPALAELERAVGNGEPDPDGKPLEPILEHQGNAALRWQWRYLKTREGPTGARRPDRERSQTNIEGAIALLSGLNRAIAGSGEEEEEAWTAS